MIIKKELKPGECSLNLNENRNLVVALECICSKLYETVLSLRTGDAAEVYLKMNWLRSQYISLNSCARKDLDLNNPIVSEAIAYIDGEQMIRYGLVAEAKDNIKANSSLTPSEQDILYRYFREDVDGNRMFFINYLYYGV